MISIHVHDSSSPKICGSLNTEEVLNKVDEKLDEFKESVGLTDAPLVSELTGTEKIMIKDSTNKVGMIFLHQIISEDSRKTHTDFNDDFNFDFD